MVVSWFLFETKAGEFLLTILERTTGLAIVRVDWLSGQPGGRPHDAGGE